jgi:hypothetical protein
MSSTPTNTNTNTQGVLIDNQRLSTQGVLIDNQRLSTNPSGTKSNQTFVDVHLTPTTPIAQAVIVNNVHVEFNENMKHCLQKARVINIICLFDIIFGLLYSIYFPVFLFPLLASLTGFFGSKKFNKTLTCLYMVYLIFNIIFRLFNFGFILSASEIQLGIIIFSVVILIVDFFILWYVFSFNKILVHLLESEVYYLRTNLEVQKKFIC